MGHGKGACTEACECAAFVRLVKANKHNAQRQPGGFGSKAERGQYDNLELTARAGVITNLTHHVLLSVEPPGCDRITWAVDFQYDDTDGVHVAHEFKSESTVSQAFRIQLKLARARYPHWRFRVSMKVKGRNQVVMEFEPRAKTERAA